MSNLEKISVSYRKSNLVKNDYSETDQYTNGHPDEISNGDEKGKDQNNGQVGSATDIKVRETLVAKNKFNKNKLYDAGTA